MAPSVSVKVLHDQANSKTRINKGTVKAGHKPVELSTSLGADMTVQLGSINECTRGNQRPSELQICTKKGLPPILPTIRTTVCMNDLLVLKAFCIYYLCVTSLIYVVSFAKI